ncbi:MAG TPA: putative Ig domain-containing protein, partial [Steroidobacteraceae bacterium]|nr:putative Ig domain-containing protein [Steroidobacteraceae bacterium]
SSQVGSYSNIIISVSSGAQTSALPAFTVTVTNSTAPLTISGTPPSSVNVGAAYAFTPTVSGPSGATLTFSIQNKPAWANFNTSNGALTGTPTAAAAGTYSNIVISVSDGTNSASLPAFSITVNQVSNGSATLNWTSVTQNTDGTALTDLAGYRVHYGTSQSNLSTVVTLSNPTVTTYLVSNLSSGTWYFAITAYASDGSESAPSNVGSKTVP